MEPTMEDLLTETSASITNENSVPIVIPLSVFEFKFSQIIDDGVNKTVYWKYYARGPAVGSTYARTLISSGSYQMASGGDHVAETQTRKQAYWDGMTPTEKDTNSLISIVAQ